METQTPQPVIIPVHQWTHDGNEVLMLKWVTNEGKAHGGFQWPLQVGSTLDCPDWNPDPVCGGGLHGWAWGMGIGAGKDPDWSATWIVYAAKLEDIVLVDGEKVKSKSAVVRFVGSWNGALNFLLPGQMAWVYQASQWAASNSGDGGTASNSGTRGAASNSGAYGAASNSGAYGAASNSGAYGAASNSGTRGAASNSGYGGTASNSGDGGTASNSGTRGAASNSGAYGAASTTGVCSAAIVTGADGKARGGLYSCIALAWWNKDARRYEMRCAEVGCGDGSDNKLKANVWYEVNAAGEFVEVD